MHAAARHHANEAPSWDFTTPPRLFDFEVESSENLRFIPLSVRFNLDRFGLRISLDQWQMLPLRRSRAARALSRRGRRARSSRTSITRSIEMLRTHANVEPEKFTPDADPVWAHADAVPRRVIRQSSLAGVSAPSRRSLGRARPFQALCARETLAQDRRGESRFPARDEGIRRWPTEGRGAPQTLSARFTSRLFAAPALNLGPSGAVIRALSQ